MITIIKAPERFSPSGNPIIWQIQSDNVNINSFQIDVTDADSGAIIDSLKASPTPATPDSAYVDLSKILTSTVNWEISTDVTKFSTPMERTVRGYILSITENLFSGAGVLSGGTSLSGVTSYVWNAQLGRITASRFLSSTYVVSPAGSIKFLTNQPQRKKTSEIAEEFLYFLQDNSVTNLAARIRTYDRSGGLVTTDTEILTDTDTFKMYQLNCSISGLKASKNISFTNIAFYVIDLVDGSGVSKSEERIYQIEPVDCALEYENLLWVNALGGIDSYSWVAPSDSISTDRFILKTNTTSINSLGIYSDLNEGIFNPSDIIINNKTTTKTSVWTQELSDFEAYWLQELFSTRQLFIELSDRSLVTALLNETSYQIPRRRYIRNDLNRINVSYTLSEGVLPSGSHAFASAQGNLDFIWTQMNALQVDLPGYEITLSGTTEYAPTDYSVGSDYH